MNAAIRPVRPDDAPALRAVERDAGQRFRSVGLKAIADNEPTSEAFIAAILAHGVAFCAVDSEDAPIGFVLAGRLDHALHIYEVSVATPFGGQGIGRSLVAAAEQAARESGIHALTLATFRDVPWNRPFYERLGFVEVETIDWTPAFHLLHAAERLSGLPIERRLFMRKEIL
ncbi:N-acetyltransferase GCN5 [Kaistia sp. 32K]|uniref:GNAT family N-acetyltransferase n=1 Tax=Kaistia sp. 32K TaxID=2795690 RepID=UPI001914E8A2|nr:GNAT family N-acetyltransferase [Kaistia sp. 32K]BCP53236.1 N-acetyltransferase GCN5 [Kaistia sp. 32K]